MSPEEGGEPFGSRYLLFEVVGRGATGRVFRARVRGSGDEVAVKVLRDELAADEEVVARCLRERQVLASVTHPNVVRVHDLVVEGDRLGIVTDFVAGGDLRRAVARPCPATEALDLMAQVCDGLAAVHAAGVVHRDVKPENVLIEAGAGGARAVRLTDFGIARLVGSTMTRLSTIAGTPLYMAPEVAGGDRATGAADMYAVGVMLYELYTGRPPFTAENPLALMRAHAEDPVPRPAGISGEMWMLLDVLLAKDPSSRPTAAATAIRLRELAGAAPERAAGDDGPTGDRPVTHTTLLRHRRAVPDPDAAPTPAPVHPGHRRRLALTAAAAVLALAAVTGGALAARRGSAPAGDALSTQGSEPTTTPGQELIGAEPTTAAAPADPLAPAPGTAPAAGPVPPTGANPVPTSAAAGRGRRAGGGHHDTHHERRRGRRRGPGGGRHRGRPRRPHPSQPR